jgi:tRNA-dihydrouridine synthase B
LGWDESSKNIEEVAERLQDVGIQALSIHGRTRVQLYKGEADWMLIGKVKENPRIQIPIFGNGDIDSPRKAKEYKERYGVDGVMIGRATIGNPWIFREIKYFIATGQELAPPTIEERVAVCKKHLLKSIEWKGDRVGIMEMRRHYQNYFKGFHDFKQFRIKLVQEENLQNVLDLLEEVRGEYEEVIK